MTFPIKLIVIVALAALLGGGLMLVAPRTVQNGVPTAEEASEPASSSANDSKDTQGRPFGLAQGKQTYAIMSDPKKPGPKVAAVTVDPFDPKIGEAQSITVTTKEGGGKPTISMAVTLITDNGSKTYPMERKGDGGNWTASLAASDTHDKTYGAIIEASDGTDTTRIELTFR